MFNQFGSNFKQQVSHLLHSIADKLDSKGQPPQETGVALDKANSPPKPLPRRRHRRERGRNFKINFPSIPPQLTAFSQQAVISLKQVASVRRHPRFWLFFGIGIGVSTSAIALSYSIYQLESSITESVEDVLVYARPETLTIKGADGENLRQIGPVTHENLKIWQIPEPVMEAFIASEDSRFENHRGVDIQGILRAAFSNLQAGEVVEGGSTITQQLARIVFLSQERSFTRKFKEMRLAQKIENNLEKEQILEKYLNLVYLGSGAYGLGDAAWVYFSKPVDQLTVSEAATLAGIVPAPSVYSPLENKEAATTRRNIVLQRMAEQKFISQAELKTAIAAPIVLKPSQPKRFERKAPYFTDYIQKELPKYVSEDALKAGGITVETTLNTQWQAAAEKAIDKAIQYGRWQGYKQAALTAVDPRNGQIKVMVGGNDYENHQYNRVTQAQRQPGSTFKAFVYTTAIAAGFSPYRSYTNAPYIVDGYQPENYGDKYTGGQVTMQQALASSLNVVAVQTLVNVGWNPIIKIAHRMGIKSDLKPTYSLALGAWEVNLLELTNAYGTLANKGVHQEAYGISRILDRHGKILYQAKFTATQAIDANTTAIMTWMLRGVVTSGTGTPAQLGSRPVAGKTGTSDKARDLWFVGYIPQLVTGVWLGNDNNRPTSGASTTAAIVWGEFMREATENMEIESFPKLPRLDGRKGSIKAEPLKPKKAYYQVVKPPETGEKTQSDTNREERRSSRRSRRRRNAEPNEQTSAPRRRSVASRSAPTRSPRETAPQAASQPAPAPVAEPVAAPVAEAAPPAPPVARKTE
ncbi:penicillin-binding protein 1A [Crocosphaera sp. XPORK-15E]|uniref:transglycosylase domain-containing protein n=1 Tax=Crocosphaera sp. XPORK-15E TaxID=3110247 RepID=UPI002B20AC84|nr:penicillin-binding protein 1A [Crocosphaera sp. XPORK-15E]MEA5535469.1 penicillin-binding protein 1A [Crocosphaera sp. XPORK-15E]